jgi:hypothetical protein
MDIIEVKAAKALKPYGRESVYFFLKNSSEEDWESKMERILP